MKFIGFYNYTVVLTYLSLISGIVGMKFASEGRGELAIICLILSGVCDMFDGVVARTKKDRSADQKNFGIQIDSLCDVVCFGVFPAVFLYFCGVNTVLGVAILAFYVLCAVIRLAFFNVLETNRQMKEDGCAKGYRGMPVTMAAVIFPTLFFVSKLLQCAATPVEVLRIIYYVVPALCAILFIADFRVPKIDIGKLLHKKK